LLTISNDLLKLSILGTFYLTFWSLISKILLFISTP
jgi:hypothetical protein